MAFDLTKRAFQVLLIQKNLPSRERGLNKKNIMQLQKANIARCAAMKPEKKVSPSNFSMRPYGSVLLEIYLMKTACKKQTAHN